MKAIVRAVETKDAAEIQQIYAHYVEHSVVTFDEVLPSVEDFEDKIRDVSHRYPWLVLEVDGSIQGYAYGNLFREKRAYAWTVESTIYVHGSLQGKGLGTQLYQALLNELERLGYLNVVGVLTYPNESNVVFHEKLGFEQQGVLPRMGYKFGRWWDIGFLVKQLDAKDHLDLPRNFEKNAFVPQVLF